MWEKRIEELLWNILFIEIALSQEENLVEHLISLKNYDTIYKEIAYQAIENNRDEPDVDIPESGKIPLYVRYTVLVTLFFILE